MKRLEDILHKTKCSAPSHIVFSGAGGKSKDTPRLGDRMRHPVKVIKGGKTWL